MSEPYTTVICAIQSYSRKNYGQDLIDTSVWPSRKAVFILGR